MGYDRLRSSLASGLDCRGVVTLPDGSVDRYYTVTDATGNRVATQGRFAELLAAGDVRSLQLVPETVRAGGEAVNAATQVHALDQNVRLYGHLDHPELGPFPFPTVSMGAPATVHVLTFDREALMLSVESADIRSWTLADLFAATGDGPDGWIDDEVVVIQNWVGFPEMTPALRNLAEVDLADATIVFDPGDITEVSAEAIESLCDALATVGASTRVVLTANESELASVAASLGIDADGTEREVRIRETLDLAAVVRHDETRAVAATGTVTTVENFDADEVTRRTGAGDRFDGGLAVGLAADLSWAEALALGNACATYFVENDRTATTEAVVELLESRSVDG